MSDFSTIQLSKDIIQALKQIKDYPRQTYNDLMKQMIRAYTSLKNNNQYDEFLHKIQAAKMNELWDNVHDEVWDHA